MIFVSQQMYLERLCVDGISNSKYYQDPYYISGKGTINDLPNCTFYAIARANESCGVASPLKVFGNISPGGFPNADLFYANTILPKGSELRQGSIACCNHIDGSMHVFYIERVYDSKHCLITDSRYTEDKTVRNDRYWRKIDNVTLEVGEHPIGVPGCGIIQGFIYLPVNDIRGRNTIVNQIEVISDYVNVRRSPEGDLLVKGCFCPTGFYTVLDTKNQNGYKWYKIQDSAWIREGEWLKYYPAVEDEKQKEIDMLDKRIADAIEILSGGNQ